MKNLVLALAAISLTPFVRADEAKPAAAPAPAEKPAKAEGVTWFTDFEAAKAEAAKSGRDLLVDFTGSDWCGWCIKLKKEVFDEPAFAVAAKNFVFVELDFPNSKPQTEELKKQNKALSEKFSIEGFPTILLLDASGAPYAKTGYQEGGPSAYLKHLAELRDAKVAQAKKIAEADKLSGDAKAKALGDIAKSIDPSIRKFQADLLAKLKAADPEDKQGLKLEEEIAGLSGKAQAAFGESKKIENAVKVFDDFIAAHKDLPAETRQKVEAERFGAFAYSLQTAIKDKAELSKKLLVEVDRITAIAPTSETATQLKQYRSKIEAMAKPGADAAGADE